MLSNNGDRPVGIYPQEPKEKHWITLVVNWKHPLERDIDINYWVAGQRFAAVLRDGNQVVGEWREHFKAETGATVRLRVDEIGDNTGFKSCIIFDNKLLVKAHSIAEINGSSCEVTHVVGSGAG